MTNTKKTWWYAIGQEKIGPCSSSELIALVTQGKLFPDTLVWKEGMPDWVPASRIKGLWQKLPPAPAQWSESPAPLNRLLSASAESAESDQDTSPSRFPEDFPAPHWGDENEGTQEPPQPESITFKAAVFRCFKKYSDFSGRASRAEYWYFFLFNILINTPLEILIRNTGGKESSFNAVAGVITLILFLPNLAVATRRLHDTGRSGWWITFLGIATALSIMAFVFMFALIISASPALKNLPPNVFDFLMKAPFYFIGILGIIFIIILSLKGDPETNKYGPPQ